MKKFLICIILSALFVIGGLTSAAADQGPFYVYWDGTCWVARVYASPDQMLYGQEIGCPVPHNMGGQIKFQDQAAMGYEYLDSPRIYKLYANGTIQIWLNNGTALSLFNSGTWSLGGPPMEGDAVFDLPSPNE